MVSLANEFELELREERIISGVGTLRVPDVATIRYARLNIDIVRMVTEPHLSKKFTPNRSRFCTLSFMKNGYVIAEEVVDYRRRQFEWQPGLWHQNLLGIQCSYEGVLQSFFNLGVALNLQPVTKENDVQPWRPINTFWDTVIVTCEGTTAIQVRLYVQALEECDSQDNYIPQEPTPPDPPIPTFPPFFPVEVSPPYDPDDPDEPYAPIPTDLPPDSPEDEEFGELCTLGSLSVTFTREGVSGSQTETFNIFLPYIIGSARLSNNQGVTNGLLSALWYGRGFQECTSEPQLLSIVGVPSAITSYTITVDGTVVDTL